jgi:hypothetical protein
MNDASPITIAGQAMAQPAFVPVSRSDIIESLLNPDRWDTAEDRKLAADVLNKIGALRQHRSGLMLNQLSDLYDPFNPDDETVDLAEPSEMERLEKRRLFNAKLKDLVRSANYHELQDHELEEILDKATPEGVHVDVDFKEYDVKLIFYRGAYDAKRTKRDYRRLFLKKKDYTIPTFLRLFLAIKFKPEEIRIKELMHDYGLDEPKARKRLKKMRRMLPPACSTDHIYLKTFKTIPRYDVEMLFPNIQVKMKYSDKLQLGGSALVGTAAWAVGTAAKLAVAVALSPLLLIGALATGVGGILYAQIRNIFITRDKYRMQLAQSLYFQNLANNQGALALIVDDAEEEDVKEEALLYTHLLREPVQDARLDSLQTSINQFLKEKFGVDISFDIHDALERLRAQGLVQDSPSGEIRAMPLGDASRHLYDRWCGALAQN